MNAPQPKALAQAHQLSLSWDGKVVFENLDLSLPPGVTLVSGDEQTGKTSLLRILAGELPPTSGWVEVLGLRADQQKAAYAQEVFYTDPLNPTLDNTSPTQWHASLAATHPHFSADLLADLVTGFGLVPHLEKPMYMLSAGSRRKVGLSAAIASGAPLTLIDQPFAALDGPSARMLCEVLQDFSNQTRRACVLADYQAPAQVTLACTINL